MMINMNNDETTVTDIKPRSVEKVSVVKNISAVQEQHGNNLPGKAEDTGRNVEQKNAVDAEALEKAVRQINENEKVVQHEIRFNIDEDSGKTVIKVMNTETSEVIRQIPNEEALAFARKLNEGADLTLFSEYI